MLVYSSIVATRLLSFTTLILS
uniref:Uncharacterized protein n=1 Tax=Anguilla anguilla TaxID=7936 RepID=A0A0E9S8F4_ANGAN